jgi:hypothetical protein
MLGENMYQTGHRLTRSVGIAVAPGLVWAALLSFAAPVDVALVDARQSLCGTTTQCPADPAPDGGDQATAEQQIISGYIGKQKECTPRIPPNPQSVNWDAPGFQPNVGGSGKITDADPRLGGQFRADWVNGHWHVEYPYC